jgi:hypothetical protein
MAGTSGRRRDPRRAIVQARQKQAADIANRLGLSGEAAAGLHAAASWTLDLRMVQWLAREGLAEPAAMLLGQAAAHGVLEDVGSEMDLAARLALSGRSDRARYRIGRAETIVAIARGEALPRRPGVTFFFGDARPGLGGVTGRWMRGSHVLKIRDNRADAAIVVESASYAGAWEAARAWGAGRGLPLHGSVHDGSPNHRDPHEVTDTLGPRVTAFLCDIDERARAAGLEL